MNKTKYFLPLAIVFLLTLVGGIFYTRQQNSQKSLISPLPQTRALVKQWQNNDQSILDIFPNQPDNYHHYQCQIRAESALAFDITENKIIYAKQARQILPIASLTKIMTAAVALQTADLNQEMVVSQKAIQDGEASMGLIAGERLSLEKLLYGLMLVSGNDAANAIAENIAGRQSTFVTLMNERARQLGLKYTHYYNPHGLDEDDKPANHSTAYELVALTKWALEKSPKLGEIVATKEITFSANDNHQQYHLENVLGLEETYPGMKGVKPGNTWKAGFCLVGLAEKNGKEIIAVLLNSPNPKEEVRLLYDYAFGIND